MKNTNMENTKKVNQEDIEVRCGFDYIGEGHNGDYNPEDPSDEMLLRLYVGISRPIPGKPPSSRAQASALSFQRTIPS